jgi:hypothetical protein
MKEEKYTPKYQNKFTRSANMETTTPKLAAKFKLNSSKTHQSTSPKFKETQSKPIGQHQRNSSESIGDLQRNLSEPIEGDERK